MSNFKVLYISLLLMAALGCAEPEIIIPPLEVETSGRTVLVEELTGVRCPNCPSANARLESILSLYGDQVVIIGIHGELLTEPLAESAYDFRNNFSIALENRYKPFIGKPSVVINRKLHPDFGLIANPVQEQWQTIVERELQTEQMFSITADILENPEDYQVNIGIIPLTDISTAMDIHVYLTESNIIDAQEDVDRIIPDYEHDHILRSVITKMEGTALGSIFTENEIINHTEVISKQIIRDSLSAGHFDVVIFISDSAGHVIQASSFPLNP